MNEELAHQLLQANNEALSFHSRLNDLEAALEKERRASQALASENKSLRSQVHALSDHQQSIEDVRGQLEEYQKERDSLRSECADLHLFLQSFQEANDRINQELKLRTEQHESARIGLHIANQKIKELMQEDRDLKICQAEIVNLQAMLGMLREINAKMDEDIMEKNKVIVSQTLFLGELKAETLTLNAINESNHQQMTRLRSELTDLRTLLNQYRDLNECIENEMCKHPGSLNYSVISSYIKDLFSYRDRCPALEKENKRLREKVESYRHIEDRLSKPTQFEDNHHHQVCFSYNFSCITLLGTGV